jgi:hypothetical protein
MSTVCFAEDNSVKKIKIYNQRAKNNYSENDVKAFVYSWFAGFDHQKDIKYFLKHLDPKNIDMEFPDFPIKSKADFKRWYQGVIDSIYWNSHEISNLQVKGNQKKGFTVSLDIHWKAETYDGKKYDVIVHQDWNIKIDENKRFIITKHRAKLK